MAGGLFDTYQAAKLLGAEPATIRQWVKRGTLPAGRLVGRRLCWTKHELIAARDSARGLSPATIRPGVADAHCGCGSEAVVKPGLDGYLVVECPRCPATMAIHTATEHVTRGVESLEIAPSAEAGSVLGSRAAMLEVDRGEGPWVAYIRLGPFVRIGATRNVRRRLYALSLSAGNLLAVETGGVDLESQLHERFAALRALKEWFHYRDELRDYVGGLQRAHVEALTDAASVAA